MDPLQIATFSAYPAMARAADPSAAARVAAEEKEQRVEEAVRETGMDAGLSSEAADARQQRAQEAAPSEDTSAGENDQPPRDEAEKGRRVDVTA